MKFGLFSHIPWPEEMEPQQIFAQTAVPTLHHPLRLAEDTATEGPQIDAALRQGGDAALPVAAGKPG